MRNFYANLLQCPSIFPTTASKGIPIALGISLVSLVASSQYYPGGLGRNNLLIWLNAANSASITQNGSGQVSQWVDEGGHNHNFTQGTSSQQPVYGATTGPNGRPALTFTAGSQQYLSTPGLPASISFTGGVSSFTVAKFNATQTAQGWQRIYDFGNGENNNNILFGRQGSSANFVYECRNGTAIGQTYTTNNPIVNGANNLYEAVQQGGTAGNMSAVAHYMAGTIMTSGGASGSNSYVPNAVHRGSNYIGRSNWAADNYFSGSMSEILLYNTALNTTQRVIAENYLAAAWGLTISSSRYTAPSTTTYRTNLIGIGYTSGTDYFLTNPAGYTDGLGLSSTSGASGFLNTAGYMVAAHNGQNNTLITNTTITGVGSGLNRWNRSWHLQKTGGNASGTVTMSFSFTDYNGGTLPTSTFGILYNATDGSFASGTNQLITTSSNVSSGQTMSFVVNAANLSAGYYTLVWGGAAILPSLLKRFEVVKQGSSNLVQWSCMPQPNNDRFEVQRETGTTGFAAIASLAPNNNGSTIAQYSFTDSKPAAGWNFYRLKMTDKDGNVTYSPIKSIYVETGRGLALSMYPNPVKDVLQIALPDASSETTICITNAMGVVTKLITAPASHVCRIPVANLQPGIYLVTVTSGDKQYTQQIIRP